MEAHDFLVASVVDFAIISINSQNSTRRAAEVLP
jgi:hypothetical protein